MALVHLKGGIYLEDTGNAMVVTVKADDAENAPVLRQVLVSEEEWDRAMTTIFPYVEEPVAPEPEPEPEPGVVVMEAVKDAPALTSAPGPRGLSFDEA